ncbi:uncharacterized protein LOC18421804 isoform X2 [Amborella trichopoda]|uniref:uncharacterized protein LOC18421804 isoform X2 n=1 Tax=Amborella trichopoda TaxID=13333 RepID=UPI0009C06535|nr:uncharacterized protein LOC18421804 isoform X2 [Amborella trichopoda]|eukprot:XP_020518116.1 uncharacterized protein LOC18421804 isoform X2 [Amborella trichopoda]
MGLTALSSPKFFEKKPVVLKNWYLMKVPSETSGKRLAVGGFHSKTHFHSCPIEERISAFRLRTSDGAILLLEGCIDEQWTLENGFPFEISGLFRIGFPYTWKILVSQFLSEDSSGFSIREVETNNGSSTFLPITHLFGRNLFPSETERFHKQNEEERKACESERQTTKSKSSSVARIQQYEVCLGQANVNVNDSSSSKVRFGSINEETISKGIDNEQPKCAKGFGSLYSNSKVDVVITPEGVKYHGTKLSDWDVPSPSGVSLKVLESNKKASQVAGSKILDPELNCSVNLVKKSRTSSSKELKALQTPLSREFKTLYSPSKELKALRIPVSKEFKTLHFPSKESKALRIPVSKELNVLQTPSKGLTALQTPSKESKLSISRSGRIIVRPLAYWCNERIVYGKDGSITSILDGDKYDEQCTRGSKSAPPKRRHTRNQNSSKSKQGERPSERKLTRNEKPSKPKGSPMKLRRR